MTSILYISSLSLGKCNHKLYVLFTDETYSKRKEGIYSIACIFQQVEKTQHSILGMWRGMPQQRKKWWRAKYKIIDDGTDEIEEIPEYKLDDLGKDPYGPYEIVDRERSRGLDKVREFLKDLRWLLLQRLSKWVKNLTEKPTTIVDESEQLVKEQLRSLYSIMGCDMIQENSDIEKEIDRIWRKEFRKEQYNPWWIVDLIAHKECRYCDNYDDIVEITATILQIYRRYKADNITDIEILEKMRNEAITAQDYELSRYITTKIAQCRQNS